MRYILIGVHRSREDAELDDITLFELAGLTLSAIGIDDDASTADPAVLKRAMEARQRLLERGTFIAIRYGAPVRSIEEIGERIAARAAKWSEILEARGEFVEVTLKIAAEKKAARPDRNEVASGREYLEKLHALRKGTLDESTRREITGRFNFAAESRWIARQDGGSEFVALVRRDQLDDVRAAGDMLRQELPSVAFILSGPWPLEVFGDE